MAESMKTQAVKGVAWSAIERFSMQGVQFVLIHCYFPFGGSLGIWADCDAGHIYVVGTMVP